MLEWTGERYVPWMEEGAIHYEHLHRYGFAKEFVKGRKVLDLACGEGYGSFMLSEEADCVIGIDIDETCVRHALSRYIKENLRFIEGSITDIPVDGEKVFDVIVCFEALEHISEHDKLFAEVKRLIKDNGIFIVSTPNKYIYSELPHYHNKFHLKELYLNEFKTLLNKNFNNTLIYGHKVYPSSNIFPLFLKKSTHSMDVVIEKGEEEFFFSAPEKKKAMYFIGLSSDSSIEDVIGNSYLLDVSETLFKKKDAQIKNLEADIRENEARIGNLEASMMDKEGQIRDFDTALRKKESEAEGLKASLAEKEGLIADLNEGITQKNTHISHLESTLREQEEALNNKNEQISHLEEILKDNEAKIRSLNETIRQGDTHISRLKTLIKDREGEITALNRSLLKKKKEIGNLKKTKKQINTQISNLEGLIREKEAAIENLKGILDQKNTQLSDLEGLVKDRESSLNHIYNSRGWKALSVYYRTRDKILRRGTRSSAVGVKLTKAINYYRQYGIHATLKKIMSHLQKDDNESKDDNQDKDNNQGVVPADHYQIPFIYPLNIKSSLETRRRINLLVPSLEKRHLYGGIATALSLFENMAKHFPKARIIITDSPSGDNDQQSFLEYELVFINDRWATWLDVGPGDMFVASAWWTAYILQSVLTWQQKEYGLQNPHFFYLIQDYEPGFYPWSTMFALAETTYHSVHPTIAVFNTEILKQYFDGLGYRFYKTFSFQPAINRNLLGGVEKSKNMKRNLPYQIVIYGRPSVDRNCFNLIIHALRRWSQNFPNCRQWSIISAGEAHPDVQLNQGVYVKSVGKLSLTDYQDLLLRSSVGISFMISPHPSYPPLEMAAYGLEVVTNGFSNKDLSRLTGNITSINKPTPENVAQALEQVCTKVELREGLPALVTSNIFESENNYETIIKQIEPYFSALISA